jgi:glycosyltransferase involved in cell wall biosynthesis
VSIAGRTPVQIAILGATMSVALAYKNFAANRNISHIGLGVAAINTAKVLRRDGIKTDVWPVVDGSDLRKRLGAAPVKHVIVSAPWIPSNELQSIANEFSETQFAVCCHSNVGFLQADRNGVKLVRELMELELGTHNIHLAGNCRRFADWVAAAFGSPCAYLPNLYYIDEHAGRQRHLYSGGTLRVGAFGATRPLKNLLTATAAAVEIARNINAPLEFWLSGGRAEGGGETVLAAVKELVGDLPHVKLVLNGWQSWPKFRKIVGHMHLLLQPSYTESFNMVTADGVAEGVPSVVSEAIDWAPRHWKADVDDTLDVARVGRHLLSDPRAAAEGLRALEQYVSDGVSAYRRYFAVNQ